MEKIGWNIHVKILKNEDILHRFKKEGTAYINYNERKLAGLVTSCLGTAC
jgi:hypothetical protein